MLRFFAIAYCPLSIGELLLLLSGHHDFLQVLLPLDVQNVVELLPDVEQNIHIIVLLEKLDWSHIVSVEIVLQDVIDDGGPLLLHLLIVFEEEWDEGLEGDLV